MRQLLRDSRRLTAVDFALVAAVFIADRHHRRLLSRHVLRRTRPASSRGGYPGLIEADQAIAAALLRGVHASIGGLDQIGNLRKPCLHGEGREAK